MSDICTDCISNVKNFVNDICTFSSKTYKRILFILFIMPFIPFIPGAEILDNGIYYSVMLGICAYIFLINFPVVIKMFHSRPTYYNDLEDNRHRDYHSKKQHQSMFVVTNQILIAFIITVMVFYYQYRYSKSGLNWFEASGVLWSVAGMLFSGYKFVAKIVKSWTAYRKKRNSKKISAHNRVQKLVFSLSDMDIIIPDNGVEMAKLKNNTDIENPEGI